MSHADSRAFYAEQLAQAMLRGGFSQTGRDFTANACHAVATIIDIENDLPGITPTTRQGVALKAVRAIADDIEKYDVTVKITFSPYSAVISLSYPAPTREERFFPRSNRAPFLRKYTSHLVAKSLSSGLAGYNPALQAKLNKAFPCPRHPLDIKLQVLLSLPGRCWRSLTSPLR